MRSLWQDFRYGLRALRKRPVFTLVVALTLALGIGANTAIFSVVNAVLLRPLPFANSDRIVGLRETLPDEGSIPIAYRTFAEWRDRTTVFENIAAMSNWNANLESGDEPVRLSGMRVSASYFAVMGVQPILGRTFAAEEDRPGAEKVVILSQDIWQSRFGGDANIIGRNIRIDGDNYNVVGVMPSGLSEREIGWMQIWKPLAIDDQKARTNYGRYLKVNARLRQGVSIAQARAELVGVMEQLKTEFHETHGKNYGVDLRPLKDFIIPARTQTALLVLLLAVGCVLLIACANVASLLLARARTREKEIAIRAAVGASRWRLIRQLLIESLLLAALGGCAALLLASFATDSLIALNRDVIPRLAGVRINAPVLGFTFVLTVLTGILFGLVPALRVTKVNLNVMLKEGGRGESGLQRNRFYHLLTIIQIALVFVLLIGSGLMVKSFLRRSEIKTGFDLDNVLTIEVALPFQTYPEPYQRVNFYQQTLERLKTLPSVETASAAQSIPLRDIIYTDPVFIENQPVPPRGEEPLIRQNVITSDYFRAMGMRLVRGRPFTEQETWTTGGVIIVNEAFARRFFGDADPVGKRLKTGADSPWLTVVGVSANTVQNRLENQTLEEMFYPYMNSTDPPLARMVFAIRTTGDPMALLGAARNEIQSMDRHLPLANMMTMRQLAEQATLESRFNLVLLNVFAGVAFVLAMIGIFGVMNYTVTQRTREFGIRLALGAQPRAVLKAVIRQGSWLVLIGIGLGLLISWIATRLIAGLLYGVSATDPLTFAAVAILLTFAAMLACYIPARRATKVDPLVALRYE